MSLLQLDAVTVRFGRVLALDGLSFSVSEGERVSIVGPNGAGKSSAVRTIAGALRPTSGVITLDGRTIGGRTPAQLLRDGVVLAPQGRRLFSSITVRENLEMGAYSRRDRGAVRTDIDRWIAFFPEVKEKLGVRAAHLSGGQQQIVALIRALMARPRVLMLDEPSMGVAPDVVRRIGHELRRLSAETGITIILVEQNIELAFVVAERVIVLSQGRNVHEASPDTLRDPDVLTTLFFGAVATEAKETSQ